MAFIKINSSFVFKIAMSGRAGVGRRPRFTFWLTFFQSYMLPLFFNGLLSYLVGMKRRTSRCFTCKRDNSYSKNPSIMPLGVFLVFKKTGFVISCKPICTKCQNLFAGEND